MIHGVEIILIEKKETGKDALGNPVWQEETVTVKNVLIAPAATDDVTGTISLYGKKAVYQLGIPKGDAHEWKDVKVKLPPPFEGTYKTVGIPQAGIEDMIPLFWNQKVLVERYE